VAGKYTRVSRPDGAGIPPCVSVESVRRPRYVPEHTFDGRPVRADPFKE